VRLLLDHHDDLVAARSDQQRRLRWHLHDLYDDLDIPPGALDRSVWLDRIAGRLRRSPKTTRVRIARELVAHIRQATRRIHQLDREIAVLVNQVCPQLVAEVGCGPLTAAKLVGELADADRNQRPSGVRYRIGRRDARVTVFQSPSRSSAPSTTPNTRCPPISWAIAPRSVSSFGHAPERTSGWTRSAIAIPGQRIAF